MKNLSKTNIIWTLLLIVAGLILVILSDTEKTLYGFSVSTALSSIGTFFVIGAIVSFYFENFSKQKFFTEIFDKITASNSFSDAGLNQLFMNSKEINYSKEIERSKSIRTLFTYSDGFIKKYKDELDRAIDRGATVELLYLKQDSEIIELMIKKGWQKKSVEANYENIVGFRSEHEGKRNLKIQFYDAIPRYAAICFDTSIYIVEHTTATGRTNVPALKLDRHGTLASFYLADIEKVTNG